MRRHAERARSAETGYTRRRPSRKPRVLERMRRAAPAKKLARFDAVFERHGPWYVGYLPAVPGVNSQERTLHEARKSLRRALEDLAELDPRAVFGRRQRREVIEVRLRGQGA